MWIETWLVATATISGTEVLCRRRQPLHSFCWDVELAFREVKVQGLFDFNVFLFERISGFESEDIRSSQ